MVGLPGMKMIVGARRWERRSGPDPKNRLSSGRQLCKEMISVCGRGGFSSRSGQRSQSHHGVERSLAGQVMGNGVGTV